MNGPPFPLKIRKENKETKKSGNNVLFFFFSLFSLLSLTMTISTGLANLICIGFTVIYIIGFYMFKIPGSRNHPPVIRARMKAVTVASLISVAIVRYLTTANLLTVLGLTFNIQALIKPLLLTSLLFLGPISIRYFDDELPFQKNFNFHHVILTLTEPLGQRNYYVVRINTS